MKTRTIAAGIALAITSAAAQGQSLPTSATIDAEPISLTAPERFQVIATLEPIRKVTIVAPADGLLRAVAATIGSTVRETEEIAELDRAEATAWLKIAEAELREKQATLGQAPSALGKPLIDAAGARVELARLALDRLTLRAPFAGRIVAAPVAAGQYVLKGTVIAELADVTILKALAPVDRRAVKVGDETSVYIEDQQQSAKIQTIVPLPVDEDFKPIRELAAPFAAAWIQVPNTKGDLEPGLRVRSASLPVTPVAVVPRSAIKPPAAGSPDSIVQVIRAEHVVDVRVKTLGRLGPERIQVAGAFRGSDSIIVSTSVPLLPGTFIRFGGGGEEKIEGIPPDRNQPGQPASVAPTVGTPSTRPVSPTPTRRPAAPPANAAGSTPF